MIQKLQSVISILFIEKLSKKKKSEKKRLLSFQDCFTMVMVRNKMLQLSFKVKQSVNVIRFKALQMLSTSLIQIPASLYPCLFHVKIF